MLSFLQNYWAVFWESHSAGVSNPGPLRATILLVTEACLFQRT